MTAKLLEVITAICNRPELLDDVTKSGNEYYFRFKGHVMSLIQQNIVQEEKGRYTLYVYSGEYENIQYLIEFFEHGDPDEIKMVSFNSQKLGDEAFEKLFSILESKYLKIDDIFDDILAEDN
jgi:hypothetical protein